MALIGEAEAYEIGLLPIQHLIEIRIGADAEFIGSFLSPLRGATGNGDELNVRVGGKNPRMLPPPTARAHEGDFDHCSMTTLPVLPPQKSSNACWISFTPMRWVMICPRKSRFARRSR